MNRRDLFRLAGAAIIGSSVAGPDPIEGGFLIPPSFGQELIESVAIDQDQIRSLWMFPTTHYPPSHVNCQCTVEG
jgi:hypothetical protein